MTFDVDAVLPELLDALALRTGHSQAAVLTAPPGAGKSTRVPLELLRQGFAKSGQIVMLQPRRLAARAVARTMARALEESVGQTVGYQVRFDRCASDKTQIVVVTEGILTQRLLSDPLLDGVSCVILDEFHERSVHADLALAFLREVLDARDDLRVLVMSATLAAAPVSRYLGNCPHVCCQTRQHPLAVHELPAAADALGPQSAPEPMARRVGDGLRFLLSDSDDDGGDVLVFLPGTAHIRACLAALAPEDAGPRLRIIPLYGALSPQEQDRALSRDDDSCRRIILATNIAETSLTVPGVTAVVDSGLHKQMRFDEAVGFDRLELRRISAASATQRAGRAGRTGPGRALRLYRTASLVSSELPEIQRVDLAGPLLTVLSFHPGAPNTFHFFESPGAARLERALLLLRRLGAVESSGFGLTALGRTISRIPLPPRLGTILAAARERGVLRAGALLTAILAEPDMVAAGAEAPTCDSDLLWRQELFEVLEQQRFTERAARKLGLSLPAAIAVKKTRDQLLLRGKRKAPHRTSSASDCSTTSNGLLRQLPLLGFPDRLCRRTSPSGSEGVMVGGRGIRLHASSGVRNTTLFVALQADAGRRGSQGRSCVRLASAVAESDIQHLFPERVRWQQTTHYDARKDRVVGRRQLLFDDLPLRSEVGARVDPFEAARALAEAAAERFGHLFQPDPSARQLIARLQLAARHMPSHPQLSDTPWPDASDTGLRRLCQEACHLGLLHSLADIRKLDWRRLLQRQMDHAQQRILNQVLPERLTVPSDRSITIDYQPALQAAGLPVLAVKLQELFGLKHSPTLLNGKLPVLLHLLAPNGRPVQITADLQSFWRTTYPVVRKDLRGRYPKHPWPEDPWSTQPTARPHRRRPIRP